MKQKMNWWLDLVLFTTFIAAYFLDFTGVEPHQWLGVFSGVLAFYHLMVHWGWVVAVSKRFLSSTSNKTRHFYILDAALLIGFVLIVATGLVISTWFNLSLDNFETWLRVHIVISISTLLILVVKLVLHWRWIARLARKIWSQPDIVSKRTLKQPMQVSSSCMGRREFLQVMSVVGIASSLAFFNAFRSLADAKSATWAPELADASSPVGSTGSLGSSGSSDSSSSSSASGSNSCTVRCGKGCSYPGHCRRYVDSNDNGRCDLGECI